MRDVGESPVGSVSPAVRIGVAAKTEHQLSLDSIQKE